MVVPLLRMAHTGLVALVVVKFTHILQLGLLEVTDPWEVILFNKLIEALIELIVQGPCTLVQFCLKVE